MKSSSHVKSSSQWVGVGRTETGHIRSSNQDAFAIMNKRGIWIVADGMGGHPAGDVAADTAVQAIIDETSRRRKPGRVPSADPQHALSEWLLAANRAVLSRAQAQPVWRGMGTTIVVAHITPRPAPVAHIAHLGDSRAYLYREGRVRQLTRDHTLVEEFLRQGAINVREAAVHPQRHVLTRAVGLERDAFPDYTFAALQTGDLLLLCSDGLTKMLTDDDMASILSQHPDEPHNACNGLIDEALARGGEDNVTVIICAQGVRAPRR